MPDSGAGDAAVNETDKNPSPHAAYIALSMTDHTPEKQVKSTQTVCTVSLWGGGHC